MTRAGAPEQPSAPEGGGGRRAALPLVVQETEPAESTGKLVPAAERARPTRWWAQASPFGDLTVVVGDAGIVRLNLPSEPGVAPLATHPERDDAVADELDEYFAGARRAFTVPVDLSGVDGFRRAVLDALSRDVPWGETVSYGELADMAGAPRAARAVGTTMATCPISVVVPCHRVIGADGRIGGYGPGGLEIKRSLLALEGVHLTEGPPA